MAADYTRLPSSDSSDLVLSHPTANECITISTSTSASWSDALPLPVFLEEALHMAEAPLARDGGMTTWILVNKNLPPDHRPILASCETFRKRCIKSATKGEVEEAIVHGIASVFCRPECRGRGYPKRLLMELKEMLKTWQAGGVKVLGSTLYSDIGEKYYADMGWHPHPRNTHAELPAISAAWPPAVKKITKEDLDGLCEIDEKLSRNKIASEGDGKARMIIIPDVKHMGWHHAKEEFACGYLFGRTPEIKGAIIGSPGKRVWAVWTRRYYRHPDILRSCSTGSNMLYLLRLVVENDGLIPKTDEQKSYLEALLQAAQSEVLAWKLDSVNIWNPAPWVQSTMTEVGLRYEMVERQEEAVASAMWYHDRDRQWIENEYYAWC